MSATTPGSASTPRTARISPDRFMVGVFAISLVTVIMAASYVFSFAAIAEAAAWTGAPAWTYPLAPVFIDGAILTYTLTYAVFRYRNEPSKRTLAFLYLFTAISTVVNVAHALTQNRFALERPETWFGALIAASAPLGALLASEEVIRLALARSAVVGRPQPATGPPTVPAVDVPAPPALDHHDVLAVSPDRGPDASTAPFDPDYDLAVDERDRHEPLFAEVDFDSEQTMASIDPRTGRTLA